MGAVGGAWPSMEGVECSLCWGWSGVGGVGRMEEQQGGETQASRPRGGGQAASCGQLGTKEIEITFPHFPVFAPMCIIECTHFGSLFDSFGFSHKMVLYFNYFSVCISPFSFFFFNKERRVNLFLLQLQRSISPNMMGFFGGNALMQKKPPLSE